MLLTTAARLRLPLAIALALLTKVIAKKRSKHEIFFRRKFVERTFNNVANHRNALRATEIEIYALVANGLDDIVDTLMFQFVDRNISVARRECV